MLVCDIMRRGVSISRKYPYMLCTNAKIEGPFPSVKFSAKLTMELVSLELTAKFSMKFEAFMPCYAVNCLVNCIVANCFVNFAVN